MRTLLIGMLAALPALAQTTVAAAETKPAATKTDPAPFFASQVIEAVKVSEVPGTSAAAAWTRVPSKKIVITPQQSIHLNDKVANAALAADAPVTIDVSAAVSAKELAVRLEWKDGSRTVASSSETNSFGDAVAIELPEKFGPGQRLPHIAMGDVGAMVFLYEHKAHDVGTRTSTFISKGFGSRTRVTGVAVKGEMTWDPDQQSWRAVFVRPLKDGHSTLSGSLFPIAFAVFDGARNERGGNKSLSSWHFIEVPGATPPKAWVDELAWGYDGQGNPEKGKATVETVCIACHWTPEHKTAMNGLAPDLSAVGAIATPSYLRDSVREPSQIVIENLHLSRHIDTNSPPDANGARPSNQMYGWYTKSDKGEHVSKMPPFAYLSEQDLQDIVAYLRTFDGTKK